MSKNLALYSSIYSICLKDFLNFNWQGLSVFVFFTVLSNFQISCCISKSWLNCSKIFISVFFFLFVLCLSSSNFGYFSYHEEVNAIDLLASFCHIFLKCYISNLNTHVLQKWNWNKTVSQNLKALDKQKYIKCLYNNHMYLIFSFSSVVKLFEIILHMTSWSDTWCSYYDSDNI